MFFKQLIVFFVLLILSNCSSNDDYDNSDFVNNINNAIGEDQSNIFIVGQDDAKTNTDIIYSEDAVNFNKVNSLPTFQTTVNSIIYGNNYVVIGNSGMILYSSDSKDWQLKNLSNSFQVDFKNIAYGNSQYFVGTNGDYSGPTKPRLIKSNNGYEWESVSVDNANFNDGNLIYCLNNFILVKSNMLNATSNLNDGIFEKNVTLSSGPYENTKLVCLNNKLIIIGKNNQNEGVIIHTDDLVNFTYKNPILNCSTSNGSVDGIAYGNNLYLISFCQNLYYSSTLGNLWTSMPTNLGGPFLDVKYKKNRFIAIGGSGLIVTSSDGLNWNQVDSGSTKNLKYIH